MSLVKTLLRGWKGAGGGGGHELFAALDLERNDHIKYAKGERDRVRPRRGAMLTIAARETISIARQSGMQTPFTPWKEHLFFDVVNMFVGPKNQFICNPLPFPHLSHIFSNGQLSWGVSRKPMARSFTLLGLV